MAAADYERRALTILGLPHPDEVKIAEFHDVGVTEVYHSSDACRAIVARRLSRVRQVLRSGQLRPGPERAEIEALNFLSFGEYLDALRHLVAIRERLQRIENATRRRDFDLTYRDNVYFYAEHLPPSPLEAQLVRIHDPDRFSPDWPGYLAYLATVAPALHRLFYRRLPVLIPEDARRRHTYITGQSGSGKSELLKVLLHSYVRSGARVSLVLIDPHGDLAEQVARLPDVANSGRLIYVHPTLSFARTPTINPFELTDTSETAVHVVAEQLASTFSELMRRAGHKELTGPMGALLIPCLSVLLRRPGSSIRDLQIFMDDKRDQALWDAGCSSPLPSHAAFFRERFHEKQFDSTKAALYTRIQSLLNSPVLYRLLVGRSTIDLDAAVNAGKIIVFALPKGGIGAETSPTFGSFVLALLQGIAIRRERVPERQRVPVHVFVDECQNFLSPSVQTILTESRKYGLHLTLAQQTFAQDMDRELAAAVMGNTAVKFCGMNDVKTLKPMDERMGVGLEALQSLAVGQFFVKVSGTTPAFKLLVPHLRARLDAEAWHQVRGAQLAAYYRPHAEVATEDAQNGPSEPPGGTAAGADVARPRPRPSKPRKPPNPRKIDFV